MKLHNNLSRQSYRTIYRTIGSIAIISVLFISFMGTMGWIPIVHAATPCTNTLNVCLEILSNGCFKTSGTTIATNQGGGCASLTAGNFPASFVGIPFTYVVQVSCGTATTNGIPTSVVSTNDGALSDVVTANNGGSYLIANQMSGQGGTSSDLTISIWMLQVPNGDSHASDIMTATFASTITSNSCSMVTAVITGLNGAAWNLAFSPTYDTLSHPISNAFADSAAGPNFVTTTGTLIAAFTVDSTSVLTDTLSWNSIGSSLQAGQMCLTPGGASCSATGPNNYQGEIISQVGNQLDEKMIASAYSATGYATTFSGTTLCSGGNSCKWSEIVIWLVFQGAGSSPVSQTQTLGNCPTKNVNTFTMVNNTIYMYEGNALGSEVVNTISTFVASTTGSGSHTLRVVVYVSTGQSASVATPFVLAYQNSIVLTTGTANQPVNFVVNIPLNTAIANPLPFNLFGIGIVGDNKIKINQSTFSGLFTLSGNPSTSGQPTSFTNGGTSSGTMLYLCGTASYQTVLPAVTITTTQAATTTSTAFTTSTATISTIGANLFSTSSNWPVIFLILLLPAGLFLGVTRTVTGALLGLMVGAVIGFLMGILPSFVFIGLIIGMVSMAFLARNRES